MKRLVLALLVAGVISGLGVTSASAAASTTTTIQHVNFGFPETDTCGFELDWHFQGSFKVTDYFDTSGTLVKEIITNTGGPFTITVTNPANGKVATTQSSTAVAITTFNPDGSVNTQTVSGLGFNFVFPGSGTILLEVGHALINSEGDVVPIGGPHQLTIGDVEAFCTALADP